MNKKKQEKKMFPVLVEYGHGDQYIDVTIQALRKCLVHDVLIIPPGDDARNELFTDPFFGVFKSIAITDNESKKIYAIGETAKRTVEEKKNPGMRALNEMEWLYSRLRLVNGMTFEESYIQQLLSVLFIPPEATVLEIGSGIGRNTLILASILRSPHTKLVALECNPAQYFQLEANQVENQLSFHVENVALSALPIMQRGLTTFPIPKDGIVHADCELVNTTTFTDLETKHRCCFDTLVVDCGMAFLDLLFEDSVNVLKNIQLIIFVNAFQTEKTSIMEKMLGQYNLEKIYHYPGAKNPDYHQVWAIRTQKKVVVHI